MPNKALEYSRREFLALASAATGGAGLAALATSALADAAAPAAAKRQDQLFYLSATSLARAIRGKEVSSEEVVSACLKRIETVNPSLNAVVQLTGEAARKQAREADAAIARGDLKGPLHGVPMTMKDSLDTATVVTVGGTKGRAQFIPPQDATVVARLKAAGAILLGKTNVPELCWAFESDNLVYGRTNNPYDLSRTPGGSSGGEAAIIAAGGSPLGLGSDAGGSIRLPCHFSGIAGIKPTSGRVPRTGHFPPFGGVLDSLWQVGPMARFVEDLSLALPIIAGPDGRDPGIVPMTLGNPLAVELKKLRVAFHSDNGIARPTRETVEVVTAAARALAAAGATVEEARPTGIERAQEIIDGLWTVAGQTGVQELLRMAGTTEISPLLRQAQERDKASPFSTQQLADLLLRWDLYRSAMLSFFDKYDLILCPVNAYLALPHGASRDEGRAPAFSYTEIYNLTGWPAAVVRGGTSPEGLPIGVQVVARPWREDVALAAAQRLETALGGWQPTPLFS